MQLPAMPFTITDWLMVERIVHLGETGRAAWRRLEAGELQLRMVKYSPDCFAGYCCDRGQVLPVLEGELVSVIKCGRAATVPAAMSNLASDFGDAAHRSSSEAGVKVFFVD